MATYKQGYLGSFRGKLGNAIGTFWKGINVMRVIPANVTNPNTKAQLMQRARFKLLVQFIAANQKFFKYGFAAMDDKMTELNAALKENYAFAVKGTYPDLSIDTTNLVASKGVRPSLKDFTATSSIPNTISLSWSDNSTVDGAAANDMVNVAVFDELTGESVINLQAGDRINETAIVTLPKEWTGRTVSVYAYAVTEDAAFGLNKMEQVSNPVSVSGILVA